MSDGLNLGINTDRDVQEVDHLVSALKTLQRALEQFGTTAIDSLTRASTKAETAYSKMQRDMDGLTMSAKTSGQKLGTSLTEGLSQGITQSTEKAKSLVRQQVAELQAYYEKQLALGWQLKPGVLQALRKQGVSLAPADRLRLSDFVDARSMETEATRLGERVRKAMASASAADAAEKLKSVNDRLDYLQRQRVSVEKQMAAEIKANQAELARAQDAAREQELSKIKSLNERLRYVHTERASIEKQMAAEIKTNQTELARAQDAAREQELSKIKSLNERLRYVHTERASIEKQMAAEIKANQAQLAASQEKTLRTLKNQSKAMWAELAQAEKEGAALLKKAAAEAAASAAAAQAQIAAMAARPRAAGTTGLGLLGPTPAAPSNADYGLNLGVNPGSRANAATGTRAVVTNALGMIVPPDSVTNIRSAAEGIKVFSVHTERLANHLTGAKAPTAHLTKEMNALHSAARGVASGFNAMWLTWGQLGPLLAGAAFSNLFVQAIQQGKEFETTLSVIDHLAEASGQEMEKLRQAALSLGTGQYGPNEVAKGLKVLALAGLDAKESLEAIVPTLQFATVAELPLDQAAESIMGIASAFGYASGDLSRVGDVIAKTAAVSMASVKDMTEAFKQSSTIAQKFKVSIEDQSLALGLLAQMGIRGSAAGTAVRNMYVELMGTSKQARRILEESLRVDIFDKATQSVKPLKQIFTELGQSLAKYDFREQMKILQDVGNERGMKALAAVMEAMAQQANKSGQSITAFASKFDDMEAKLKDAAGFMAIASAGMASTTENIMKSVGNTLQGALIQAFDEISPYLIRFSLELREAFKSEEFVNGIKDVVRGVGDLLKALYENIQIIGALGAAYLTWKVAAIAVITPISLLATGATGLSAALTTKALAMGTVATSSAVMAAGVTTAANASLFLSRALNAVKLALGPIALLASAAAAAYMLFGDDMQTAADKSADAHARMQRDSQEAADASRLKMQVTNESLEKEIERIETFLKNGGDEKRTQEELANAAVTASQIKILAAAEEAAALKITAAVLKEMEASQVSMYGLGADRKQRADALMQEAEALREQGRAITGNAQKQIDAQNDLIARVKALRMEEDKLRASQRNRPLKPTGSETLDTGSRGRQEDKTAKAELQERRRFTLELIKDWNAAAEAANRAFEEARKGALRLEQAVEDAQASKNDSLVTRLAAMREEVEYLGLTTEQVDQLKFVKEEQLIVEKELQLIMAQNADAGPVQLALLQQEINLRKQLLTVSREKSAKQADIDAAKAAKTAADKAADEWQKASERIEKDITDALMRGFESGKGFARVLRDTLVNMFKTLVLRPVISAVVSPVAGAITGALGLPGAAGSAMNLASGASTLYNAGSSVYNWLGLGASAGTGIAASAGTGISLAASTGSGLGLTAGGTGLGLTGTAASGASVSSGLAAGGAASTGGMSSIMAAAPWLLGGLAVVSLLRSLDKGKTYHTGGLGSFSAMGGSATGAAVQAQGLNFGLNPRDFRSESESAAVDMARAVVGLLDSTASTFGKEAGYYAATAFADDTSKDGAWGALMLRLGDKIVLDWGQGADKWPGREFANGEAGAKEYAAAVAKDVRDYLITQTPDWADAMLLALGNAPTMETLSAVVGQINAAAAALAGMGKASKAFASLSSEALSALMRAMGGAEAAASTLSGYYENFYSESERTELATARLTEQLRALGVTMPTSREAFRALVDAALAAGNTSLASSLLNLSGAFAAIKPAAETAADAIKDKGNKALSALSSAISREKQTLQLTIDAATSLQDEVRGVFDVLSDGIKSLRADALGPQLLAAQGQQFINESLAAALATGALPDAGKLGDAISAARDGISKGQFSSDADRSYAALVLAGQLETLQTVAGDQLTQAERQLRAAQVQIEQLDKTLAYWDQQVALSQGGIDATKTVAEAIRDLQEALKPGSTGRAKDGAGGSNATRGIMSSNNSSMDAYRSIAEGPPVIYTRDANGNNGSFRDTANWAQVGGRWINISGQTMANPEDYWAARLQHAYDSPAADMKDTWQQLTSGMFAGDAGRLIAAARGAGLSENVIASYVQEFMPKLATGTNYIPQEGPYYLHRGEAVVPAAYNPALGGGVNNTRLEQLLEDLIKSHEEGNDHTKKTADVLEAARIGDALAMKAVQPFAG